MKYRAILFPAIAAAALTVLALAAPVLAEEIATEEFGPSSLDAQMSLGTLEAEQETFSAVMSDDELDANRGTNSKLVLNKQTAIMEGNHMEGDFTTGDINISNSFNNMNGVGFSVNNTGNQVNMNVITNIEVEFHN
jgi:hypothetical protein